jgi:hypothetical protein
MVHSYAHTSPPGGHACQRKAMESNLIPPHRAVAALAHLGRMAPTTETCCMPRRVRAPPAAAGPPDLISTMQPSQPQQHQQGAHHVSVVPRARPPPQMAAAGSGAPGRTRKQPLPRPLVQQQQRVWHLSRQRAPPQQPPGCPPWELYS